jgi:hypothetical protein
MATLGRQGWALRGVCKLTTLPVAARIQLRREVAEGLGNWWVRLEAFQNSTTQGCMKWGPRRISKLVQRLTLDKDRNSRVVDEILVYLRRKNEARVTQAVEFEKIEAGLMQLQQSVSQQLNVLHAALHPCRKAA